MTDAEWTDADDEQLILEVAGEPLQVASAFLAGLGDVARFGAMLPTAVEPGTDAAWGDFSAAASLLDSLGDWGMVSPPAFPEPNVAVVKIVDSSVGGGWVQTETPVYNMLWLIVVNTSLGWRVRDLSSTPYEG